MAELGSQDTWGSLRSIGLPIISFKSRWSPHIPNVICSSSKPRSASGACLNAAGGVLTHATALSSPVNESHNLRHPFACRAISRPHSCSNFGQSSVLSVYVHTPPFAPSTYTHRYLTDNITQLPLGVMSRLLSAQDAVMALLPLVDSPPWVRDRPGGKVRNH